MDERNIIYRMRFQGYSDAEIARCPGASSRHPQPRVPTQRESRRPLRSGQRPDPGEPPPADLEGLSISHTTIYRWIGSDPQRTQQFRPWLRIAKKTRRKPYGKPSRRGQIPGKRSLDERPKEINERTRLGDWEGDTVVGKGHQGVVLTCVDRASRYWIARQVEACATEPVTRALQQTIRRRPAAKRRSLTLDNGREFARPLALEKKLDLPVYFAHPYHCWERGTNENTNGLLRQYLPKGTDLTQVAPEQLRSYVRQINHRPRKCLDFQTAFEVFRTPPPE